MKIEVPKERYFIMAKKFSTTEKEVTNLFTKGSSVYFNGEEHTILISGKPSPPLGECKTDTYLLIEDSQGNLQELKISIKQHNADFVENKTSLERAKQIFGNQAQDIIYNSIQPIRKAFENDYLITFNRFKRTEARTLKIGWKYEIMNKKSGEKSGELNLSHDQLIDVYSGTNLNSDKKNSKVDSNVICDSGVANYILELEDIKGMNPNNVLENLQPIDEYVKNVKMYFACKAINYRSSRDRWDGNRPLAVYVEWYIQGGKLHGKLKYERPLNTKANQIGLNIRSVLNELRIGNENFMDLQNKVGEGTKYYLNK